MCFQGFAHFACGHRRIIGQLCALANAVENPLWDKSKCFDYRMERKDFKQACGLGGCYCRHAPDGIGFGLDMAHFNIVEGRAEEEDLSRFIQHDVSIKYKQRHDELSARGDSEERILMDPELMRLAGVEFRFRTVIDIAQRSRQHAIAEIRRLPDGLRSSIPWEEDPTGVMISEPGFAEEIVEAMLPDRVAWAMALKAFPQRIEKSPFTSIFVQEKIAVTASDYGRRTIYPPPGTHVAEVQFVQGQIQQAAAAPQGDYREESKAARIARLREEAMHESSLDGYLRTGYVTPGWNPPGGLPPPPPADKLERVAENNRRRNRVESRRQSAQSKRKPLRADEDVYSQTPEPLNVRRSTRTRKKQVQYAESPDSSRGKASKSASPAKSEAYTISPMKSDISDYVEANGYHDDGEDESPRRIGGRRGKSKAGMPKGVAGARPKRAGYWSNKLADFTRREKMDLTSSGTTSVQNMHEQSTIQAGAPTYGMPNPAVKGRGPDNRVFYGTQDQMPESLDQTHATTQLNTFTSYQQRSLPLTASQMNQYGYTMPLPYLEQTTRHVTDQDSHHTTPQAKLTSSYPMHPPQATPVPRNVDQYTEQRSMGSQTEPPPYPQSDPFAVLNSAPDWASLGRVTDEGFPDFTPSNSDFQQTTHDTDPSKRMVTASPSLPSNKSMRLSLPGKDGDVPDLGATLYAFNNMLSEEVKGFGPGRFNLLNREDEMDNFVEAATPTGDQPVDLADYPEFTMAGEDGTERIN